MELNKCMKPLILDGKVLMQGDNLVIDKKARFLADGIASAAFIV
jgi:hypothetical protein